MAAAAVLIISAIAHYLARNLLVRVVRTATKRTTTKWDDILVETGVFSRLAHIAPALVIDSAARVVLTAYPDVAAGVRTATFVYMALIGMIVFDALLNAVSSPSYRSSA